MHHLQQKTEESCGNGLRARGLPSFREAVGGTDRRREKGSGGLPSMLTPIFYVRVHHRPPFHILKQREVAKGKQGTCCSCHRQASRNASGHP